MINSKYFSIGISLLTLVIVLAYVRYADQKMKSYENVNRVMEDGSIAPADLDESLMQPSMAISFDLPTSASFSGEAVPMELPDVRERLDKELHINTYWHNNTIFLMKRAHRWFPQIEAILKKNNIPDDFKYLPLIESGLMNDISPKDAVGFWQIVKSAGKENGLEITDQVDERYDPVKATEAACRYLNKAYKKFGNWTSVAASYNRGMGGIERAIENQNVSSYYDLYLNDETARYVFRIIACKEIIEHPVKYGFNVKESHLYNPEPLRYVTVNETIPDLIAFAQKNGTNYKLLKRHNPWLRDEKLVVKKGKSYRIALPA
ncbi:MAG: transglycosylase SLT domain-containing protein [Cyclobacteriaceae bacterium]|nr:transglycosylase SLT domain-containing protein [Cyclobacteriaceae bacterium]